MGCALSRRNIHVGQDFRHLALRFQHARVLRTIMSVVLRLSSLKHPLAKLYAAARNARRRSSSTKTDVEASEAGHASRSHHPRAVTRCRVRSVSCAVGVGVGHGATAPRPLAPTLSMEAALPPDIGTHAVDGGCPPARHCNPTANRQIRCAPLARCLDPVQLDQILETCLSVKKPAPKWCILQSPER